MWPRIIDPRRACAPKFAERKMGVPLVIAFCETDSQNAPVLPRCASTGRDALCASHFSGLSHPEAIQKVRRPRRLHDAVRWKTTPRGTEQSVHEGLGKFQPQPEASMLIRGQFPLLNSRLKKCPTSRPVSPVHSHAWRAARLTSSAAFSPLEAGGETGSGP